MVLSSFLNSFNDYDACTIFAQLQEGGLSYLAHKELGLIVKSIHRIFQIDFSSFIAKQESNVSISSFDHFLSLLIVIHLIIFPSARPIKVVSHLLIFIVKHLSLHIFVK